MTQQRRGSGWGTQPPYRADNPPAAPKVSGAGDMLHKSRIGKGKDEPMRCVSCWLVKHDARQRDCLCVRCDACVRNNTEAHKGTCTHGEEND